ncbi:hypothetical protein PSA5_14220 [Pseudomonas syringae pv. actinidiae]|nr:hypothetical protein PSA5_14220 [Pseudomonas syringae pv. actinidiae]
MRLRELNCGACTAVLSSPLINKRTAMLIPYDQLEPDTLTRLIEDFVTREALTTATKRPCKPVYCASGMR